MDGVNVAARLETLAEPGDICIAASVHTAVGRMLALEYESIGEQQIKNIAKPVHAYRVVLVAPEKRSSDADTPIAALKILVADDHLLIREVLKNTLADLPGSAQPRTPSAHPDARVFRP